MLVIINNGKGAEDISRFMRVHHKIINPTDKMPENLSGVIFTDGKISKDAKTKAKILIEKGNVPIMFLGNSYSCMLSCMNVAVKENKVSKKQERLMISKPCPLLLDVKKSFNVIKDIDFFVNELPNNLNSIARSQKNEFEMVQDIEKPFFGLNFNPELGLDGFKILQNFSNFIEMWEKYHK